MRISTAMGAAALAMLLGAGSAGSAGLPAELAIRGPKRFTASHERALPPVGFVQFCMRNPADCRANGSSAGVLAMSPARWRTVYRVNAAVNGEITPASDAEIYGEAEHWAYPTAAGDCEDYVLLKKRRLEAMGFARSGLLITVVLDERNAGHAVLMLRTGDGDYVLDNRRNEIRRWSDLDYTYLKRQSLRDPREWVSIAAGPTRVAGRVSGR